jgi:hypothetical protein
MASDVFSDGRSYDVFLSYNSADHNVVEYIARKLRDEGLACSGASSTMWGVNLAPFHFWNLC